MSRPSISGIMTSCNKFKAFTGNEVSLSDAVNCCYQLEDVVIAVHPDQYCCGCLHSCISSWQHIVLTRCTGYGPVTGGHAELLHLLCSFHTHAYRQHKLESPWFVALQGINCLCTALHNSDCRSKHAYQNVLTGALDVAVAQGLACQNKD